MKEMSGSVRSRTVEKMVSLFHPINVFLGHSFLVSGIVFSLFVVHFDEKVMNLCFSHLHSIEPDILASRFTVFS